MKYFSKLKQDILDKLEHTIRQVKLLIPFTLLRFCFSFERAKKVEKIDYLCTAQDNVA